MIQNTFDKSLKYALIERERKFLIQPNQDLIKKLPFKTITDHYINNTFLRFRKVKDELGFVYKLTKKVPTDSFDKLLITTIYLSDTEYEILNSFHSVLIEKIRYIKKAGGFMIGIDIYIKGSDVLWMAEIEFDSDEDMTSFKMPLKHIKEVTGNPDFSGYELAKRFGIVKKALAMQSDF